MTSKVVSQRLRFKGTKGQSFLCITLIGRLPALLIKGNIGEYN